MADESPIVAAQQAFLKIENEDQRTLFIAWCRDQNKRAFFREVVRATEEGIADLKVAAEVAGEKVMETGSAALNIGKDVGQGTLDAGNRVAKSFDQKMRDLLGGDKQA